MTKKKPGPKAKPIDIKKAYDAARDGADMKSIAKAIGRAPNPNKLANLAQKNPELRQAIKQGRDENIQEHVEHVIPMAQWAMKEILSNPAHPGFTAATIFLHKTVMGFRETHKHEVSGEVSHVHSLSAEDRVKRIAELRRELESAVDVQFIEEKSDDSQ